MKILLAYDGSSHANEAMERAAMICMMANAELTVISVTPDMCFPMAELPVEQCEVMTKAFARQSEEALRKVAETLASRGIKVATVLESGPPADKILDTAEAMDADLIVLGSRGLHSVERFLLGSVSSKVAKHAACDVLIVK